MQGASWRNRAGGAALALLVQLSFLLLVLLTPSRLAQPMAGRETILLLPPPAAPKPYTIDARAPQAPSITRPIVPTPPSSAPTTIAPLAPPGGIAGFGRSLFGCAPERYANLTPDERAHCPKPGEGLAMNAPSDVPGTRSHVKDEAHWRQEWARVHGPTHLPCGTGDPATMALCLLGKIADGSLSDFGDPSTWPIYAVKQLPDRDFRKIEEAYRAWHRDHPVAPAPN